MKFVSILFILIFTSTLSSKDVWLYVNHHIDGQEFIKEDKIYNINGHDSKLIRLQYYLTHIVFIDKNGNRTTAPNKYNLIDIDSVGVYLGDIDIEPGNYTLEYKFGIEESVNHGDPSVWPEGHPLNLAYASMHWGWASGYRFLAIEGIVKDIWNRWLNHFQFHLVGNQYYHTLQNEVVLSSDVENSVNYISFDVNVTDILGGVDQTTNNFIHGSGGANDVIFNNIRNGKVIKSQTLSVEDKYTELAITPNPVVDLLTINQGNTNLSNLNFELVDINGNIIQKIDPRNTLKIDMTNYSSGVYFINVFENEKLVKSLKFIK